MKINLSKVNDYQRVHLVGLSALAAFWSYSVNHSVLWAIFHYLVGPVYVAYRIVFFTNLLPK